MAMQHHGRKHVVTIREDIGLDERNLARHALRGKAPIIDGGRNTFNDDAAASVKTGSGHELALCELHASAEGALGGDRIVQLEKALPVAAHRENVLVAGSLTLGAIKKRTRIAAEVGGGEGAIVGN